MRRRAARALAVGFLEELSHKISGGQAALNGFAKVVKIVKVVCHGVTSFDCALGYFID